MENIETLSGLFYQFIVMPPGATSLHLQHELNTVVKNILLRIRYKILNKTIAISIVTIAAIYIE